MKVLVTGGGGFLGSAIAQSLAERGDDVAVLGRQDYAPLRQAGIETIKADLRDAPAIAKACQGRDTVVHTAAHVGVWGKRQVFWDINVGGTDNVIAGCRSAGVGRLVHTSSPSVIFGRSAMRGVTERQPYPDQHLAHYPETKAEAERRVLAANGPDLATMALRPHLIWGPGDPFLFPRIVDRARRRKLAVVGDGSNLVDITYIDNAASAHLLAIDKLRPDAACAGKAYFISQGDPVQLWPWLNKILARLGVPEIERRVSMRSAMLMGGLFEFVYKLFGIATEPMMTRFVAFQLGEDHYFDISAARADLGYAAQVSTELGEERLIEYLKHHAAGPKQAM